MVNTEIRYINSLLIYVYVKVDDTNALPGYMYRDDALLLHYAILNYVTEVLTNVYGNIE